MSSSSVVRSQVNGEYQTSRPTSARVGGGDLQPVEIAAGDPHRGAVQVLADDLHLALDDLAVEGIVGDHPGVDEASVVGDAVGSHDRDHKVRAVPHQPIKVLRVRNWEVTWLR